MPQLWQCQTLTRCTTAGTPRNVDSWKNSVTWKMAGIYYNCLDEEMHSPRVKSVAQVHTARRCQSQDWNPSILTTWPSSLQHSTFSSRRHQEWNSTQKRKQGCHFGEHLSVKPTFISLSSHKRVQWPRRKEGGLWALALSATSPETSLLLSDV